MDYLQAVQIPTREVQLAGRVVRVNRCPLLTHIRLRNIAVRLAASDPGDRLDAVFDYVSLASGLEDLSGVGVEELAPALDILFGLNDELALLPWQEIRHMDDKPSAADYANRELAVIVSKLASAFGWSEEEIHNLQPEAAACYIQEVLLHEWKQQEWQRSLSEIAYDEHGKYKPYPEPDWMRPRKKEPTLEEAKKVKIPARFLPSGVVIDVSKGLPNANAVEPDNGQTGGPEDQG